MKTDGNSKNNFSFWPLCCLKTPLYLAVICKLWTFWQTLYF